MKVDIYLARIYIEIRLNIFLLPENFMRERRTTDEDERKDNLFLWGVKRDTFRRCKVGRSQQAAGCVGDYKYILKSPNLKFAGRRSGVIRRDIVA